MASPTILILSSGGMRSLVATALTVEHADPAKVALLHVKDGRACASIRLEHARRQAQHYKLNQVIEVDLPHLHSKSRGAIGNTSGGSGGFGGGGASGGGGPALVRPQIVLVGLAHAIDLGVTTLVWPCQFNGDFEPASRITEQLTLLQQVAELDFAQLPTVRTPLLELTDQQLVELGGQSKAPWELSWSCQLCGSAPCRLCVTCKRRRAAFDAAGIIDPIEQLVPAR